MSNDDAPTGLWTKDDALGVLQPTIHHWLAAYETAYELTGNPYAIYTGFVLGQAGPSLIYRDALIQTLMQRLKAAEAAGDVSFCEAHGFPAFVYADRGEYQRPFGIKCNTVGEDMMPRKRNSSTGICIWEQQYILCDDWEGVTRPSEDVGTWVFACHHPDPTGETPPRIELVCAKDGERVWHATEAELVTLADAQEPTDVDDEPGPDVYGEDEADGGIAGKTGSA